MLIIRWADPKMRTASINTININNIGSADINFNRCLQLKWRTLKTEGEDSKMMQHNMLLNY
jgi:hypothetical protein